MSCQTRRLEEIRWTARGTIHFLISTINFTSSKPHIATGTPRPYYLKPILQELRWIVMGYSSLPHQRHYFTSSNHTSEVTDRHTRTALKKSLHFHFTPRLSLSHSTQLPRHHIYPHPHCKSHPQKKKERDKSIISSHHASKKKANPIFSKPRIIQQTKGREGKKSRQRRNA